MHLSLGLSMLVGPHTRCIILRKLRVHSSIGILPHELRLAQPLLCDADVWVTQEPPRSDQIAEVLDYRQVREKLIEQLKAGHTNLLETLAEQAARELCALRNVVAVQLRIEKPNAFDDAESVGIEIFRFRKDFEGDA